MILADTWWYRHFVEPGKIPLLLCFLAFVVTFLATRTITRLIRAGRGPFKDNVGEGGLHVHHAVYGVFLLVTGAIMAIAATPETPWREIAACIIGIGASLVLDEFALILHLTDVYWKEEGRASVQVVALVIACLACVLLGLSPFGVNDIELAEHGLRAALTGLVFLTIATAIICVAKGKYRLTLLAIFIPLVAIVGAIRLARPGSAWYRHRYRKHPNKKQKALERTRAFDARWGRWISRLGDAVAGRPTPTASPGA